VHHANAVVLPAIVHTHQYDRHDAVPFGVRAS